MANENEVGPGKRVLFISHDASRTGAPIILLRTLRWLRANTRIEFDVLLREGGELRDEFAAVADVIDATEFLARPVPPPLPRYRRIFSRPRVEPSPEQLLLEMLGRRNIGLIYSNTVTNGELLRLLSPLECPVISHIHELDYWIRCQTPLAVVQATWKHSDCLIAVAKAVKDNLVMNCGVPAERIEVVPGFIPVADVERYDRAEAKQALCQRLGIPSSARLVAGCGTGDWRKGPDLLIQVAASVRRSDPEQAVHFLWIGEEASGPSWERLMHDVRRAAVADRMHFLGKLQNPFPVFAALDLFLVTSREDPFPLVMLENAAAGKPIVCFQGAGGAAEFVGDDCGRVVPYLHTEAMAQAVLELLSDDALRQQMGARAAEKARRFHDMDVGAAKIRDIIQRFLFPAQGGRRRVAA